MTKSDASSLEQYGEVGKEECQAESDYDSDSHSSDYLSDDETQMFKWLGGQGTITPMMPSKQVDWPIETPLSAMKRRSARLDLENASNLILTQQWFVTLLKRLKKHWRYRFFIYNEIKDTECDYL